MNEQNKVTDKKDLPRAEEAFYTALKILGYEKVVRNGEKAMLIEGNASEIENELLFILDNIYRTALTIVMINTPEEKNLIAPKKLLEYVSEMLTRATVDIIEKTLEREAKVDS